MKVISRICVLLAVLSVLAFGDQTLQLSPTSVPQPADVLSRTIQEMKANGQYDQNLWDQYYGINDPTRRFQPLVDVGGDVIGSCAVITSLPYGDTGNTCQYNNDYDEACPYTGSTSPDVVYCFTPTANICVDISLCNTGTNYDTKLYVYEGSYTPGYPFACNDDYCPGWISELHQLQLDAGTVYYIVVDGYGGDCGDYHMTVIQVDCPPPPPPPPECPANTLAGQIPHLPAQSWTAGVSDLRGASPYGPVIRFESYAGANQPVCDIHFWGLSLSYPWASCNEDPMTFEIKFYPDSLGYPGTPACTYVRTISRQATGLLYSVYPLYQWGTILDPCCTLTSGWVSIQGVSIGTPQDCWFLWMSSSVGNGASWRLDPTGLWAIESFDLNYCLTAHPPDTCEFPYDEVDMGDLPACNYPTLVGNPAHALTGVAWLGAGITGEPVPNILNVDPMDDGVIYQNLPWMPCTPQTVTVLVTAGPNFAQFMSCGRHLYLNGWKDGNVDGDFCDVLCPTPGAPAAPEWIVQDAMVMPGPNVFNFIDPGVTNMGVYDGVFRWRLTSQPVGPHGFGLVDTVACPGMTCGTYAFDFVGEVEDYIIEDMQLSVELQSFEAIAGDGLVSLRWSTASETNNDHFVLYKRTSGEENFSTVATITGSGTTSQQHNYEYVDQAVVNGVTYEYRLADVDINGVEILHDMTVSATPAGTPTVPTTYALYQNYPNPFNPITTIGFDIKETGKVTLKIYNLLGREVVTLVNREIPAGSHSITWDASGLASGIYLYQLQAGDYRATKKLVLMK